MYNTWVWAELTSDASGSYAERQEATAEGRSLYTYLYSIVSNCGLFTLTISPFHDKILRRNYQCSPNYSFVKGTIFFSCAGNSQRYVDNMESQAHNAVQYITEGDYNSSRGASDSAPHFPQLSI